jgi:hypothetical protein
MNTSINKDYSHEKVKVHAGKNFTGVDVDGQGIWVVFYEFFIYEVDLIQRNFNNQMKG